MKNKLQALIDAADNLHTATCDEYICEQTQDEAYVEYHKTVAEIAEAIPVLTNGRIDGITAREMAHFRRGEIIRFLSKGLSME